MNALERIIRELIATQGAISLANYMELALQHPEYGYYRVREPVGREGDFITAPEVSQMFGEMIGVWCVEAWRRLGSPDSFVLLELGPGRGTMLRDVLRATAHVGGFHDALRLYLVDSDKALRASQRAALGGIATHYLDQGDDFPSLPTIILANEFFDALPVRQFEQSFRGWTERMVTVENDALVVALRPLEAGERFLIPADQQKALPGTVIEVSPKGMTMMHNFARHLVGQTGAMLVIDYGYVSSSGGATLQAVSRHAHADIFDRPGEVDLTAHVDFTTLAASARQAGAQVSPIVGQGEFLKNIGIEIRADTLKKRAPMLQAAAIDADLHRLTDAGQMGELFKVMEITSGF